MLRSRVLDSGLTMKQCFKEFDKDGSGCIEREEMRQVLRSLNVTFTEVLKYLYSIENFPPRIKYIESLLLFASVTKAYLCTQDQLDVLYFNFDFNGDGKFQYSEFVRLIQNT